MLLVHLLLLELLVLVLVLLLFLPHARVVHVQVGREVVDVDRTRVVAGQGRQRNRNCLGRRKNWDIGCCCLVMGSIHVRGILSMR